jgi:UDP-glucose 4-epimerase
MQLGAWSIPAAAVYLELKTTRFRRPSHTTVCSNLQTRAPRGPYWHDDGIASIGLRPFVVYGPGRETGLTATVTRACQAAASGVPYVIQLTGPAALVYVDDVAAAYEAAVGSKFPGAHTINLTGTMATMDHVIEIIKRIVPGAAISCEGSPLPSISSSPNEYDSAILGLPPERTLEEGIKETIEYYGRFGTSSGDRTASWSTASPSGGFETARSESR